MSFSRQEIEDAFAEYRRRGEEQHDWAGWADLFTDDALYVEHYLGTFEGRDAIKTWIVDCMAQYPAMSLHIDWYVIDEASGRVAFYIWNNLPDPTGTGKRYAFPNTTLLQYAGGGKWSHEADFYNPADAKRVWMEWFGDGGRLDTAPDKSLRGIDGWHPAVPEPAAARDEVEREFLAYRARGDLAVATGDWHQWADQFTDDARYLEHHYGRFASQDEIRSWITATMGPFPDMTFPVDHYIIEGNRVMALIPNVLPDPTGGDERYAFDVHVILHYAGNGRWAYEEDVYNPDEAGEVVGRWVAAGGIIPTKA
jgi:ketosteroid isomerase-like protein